MGCKLKQNRRIIYASILSGIILIGIVLLQLIWFLKASEIAEYNYNKRLQLALGAMKTNLLQDTNAMPLNQIKERLFQTLLVFDTDTPHLVYIKNLADAEAQKAIQKENHYEKFEMNIGSGSEKLVLLFKPKSKIVSLDINQWLWFSSFFIILISMGVGGFLYLFIKQRKLSEMKTDFVNMLSHEFKTPVATISLISEVLGRNNSAGSQEKIHRYAGILQAEIARLKLLVDKTLQVASFDNKTVKLELVETNINKLVQESSDYISATFDKNKPEISFNFNITNDTIVADEAHLRNVFLNILDNSIKYSVNPVQIQIKTYQEANDFIIEIADNGSGIEKKNLPHIFDKFYRVSTGNVHNIQGAGLGLYYSKQIIEFHKGNIIANSSLGKGTTMFIRLPKN